MKILFYTTPAGRKPVSTYIENLSLDDQARFTDLWNGIQVHGLAYDRADFRQLNGKLWEIKLRTKGNSYRVAYVVMDHQVMYWLHIFKKSGKKTPLKDLHLAIKRMREVLAYEEK